MAWIESHQSLEKHPKTFELMNQMGWDLDTTIGKLHRFWWWCVDYAEDGDLRKHNDARIAMAMGVATQDANKLVQGMIEACWLDREPYFRIHDWWNFVGPLLRRKYKEDPEKWMEVRSLYIEGKSLLKSGKVNGKVKMTMSEWAGKVKEKDNHTCQLCGIQNKDMYAYHIKKQSEYPSLIYDVENGVTLCKTCHKKVSRRDNQYVEILENKVSDDESENENNWDGKVMGKYRDGKVNLPLPTITYLDYSTLPKPVGFGKDSVEIKLAKRLFEKIRTRDGNAKEPKWQDWASDIDKIMRIDKRSEDDVCKVIDWCQEDAFWQNNILSPKKLRKQFQQLLLKANSKVCETQTKKPYGKTEPSFDYNSPEAIGDFAGYVLGGNST